MSIRKELSSLSGFHKIVIAVLVVGLIAFFINWRNDVEYERCYEMLKGFNSSDEEVIKSVRDSKCGRLLINFME